MKITLPYLLFLSSLFYSCQETGKPATSLFGDTTKIFILDTNLKDTAERRISFLSDKYSSYFNTPIELRFFSDGMLTDSVIELNFEMDSWYFNKKDTIDLVAHTGVLESRALLLRFINQKPSVFFYRAPHGHQNYFKINKSDYFTDQIEVPPINYKLKLSQIPDTINKPVVFGYIDMESSDYYDKRDALQQKNRVQMKFYFRSQFKKFDY